MRYAKRAIGVCFEPHWHEEFAIGLIDSGVMQLNHEGKTEHLITDEVAIVNAGEVHRAGEVILIQNFVRSTKEYH